MTGERAIIDLLKLQCFKPIGGPKASALILGSMPGAESLRKKQYYAHSRNLFWNIMGRLLGAGPERKYEDRVLILTGRGFAVWDVLKACERTGSLDSAIREETIEANDFVTFFEDHPRITHVFFNGTKAQAAYKRYVIPTLGKRHRSLRYERLPSTSPAHAGMSADEKIERWKVILDPIQKSAAK
jgi:hypoxanthine-DNA glycosylase